MSSPLLDPRAELADAVEEYRAHENIGALLARLDKICDGAAPELLADAVEPFREIPEVAGPVYERIVAAQPENARALVILANAYWLSGRGPEAVGALASRAIAADPTNRGAWHLWALTESEPRLRMERWVQVSKRFPEDDLARANVADNAASVASAEHDAAALRLALDAYQALRDKATHPQQIEALDAALGTLRRWKL